MNLQNSKLFTSVLLALVIVLSITLVSQEEEDEELPTIVIPTTAKDNATGNSEDKDPYPYFMIIGAVRSGTTSLARYLEHNPKICISNEPNFWNVYQKFSKGYEWYKEEYFPHCTWPTKFIGDKTSSYIYHPQTSARVRRVLPKAKFIALLRNPVERLHSHWYNERCRYNTKLDFEEYLQENDKVVDFGYYDKQLKHWFDLFPREQFLILKSEDFFKNPRATLNSTQDFIGVPRYPFTNKSLSIKYFVHCTDSEKPALDATTRKKLEELYAPSVKELESMTGVKFGWF